MASLTYAQCIRMVASIVQARICLLNDTDGVNVASPALPEEIDSQTDIVCGGLTDTLHLGEEGCQIDLNSMQFRLDVNREVAARWGVILG